MTGSVVLLVRPGDEPSGHPVVPRFLDLLDSGWDAHVVSIGPGAAESGEIPAEARSRVHEARPGAAPVSGRALRRRASAPVTLSTLLGELSPQLVHFPTTRSVLEWRQTPVGLTRTRLVAGFSGHDLDGQPFERLWSAANGFHFESEALADFARRSGMAGATAAVVPPLADAGLLARPPQRESDHSELRILGVGPLSWTQGLDHAIAAVRLLRDRGLSCRYRIVGAGEYEDAVGFARYQLGVEETVEVVKPGGRGFLREHFAWADVLVVAAVVPTSPKTVLDAQAAGLPVVTTEAAADGAIVVPRRDASALADALTRIATDADLRRRLADEGRLAATRSQDIGDQLRRFRELYTSVLAAASA